MVIWLKAQPKVLAFDADVVRAEDVARVVELSDALEALDEVVQATMRAATQRARELVEAARREADAFAEAARRKFDNSARLGYAAGHRRAAAEVHARALARARGDRDELRASSDRLARLVMKAVEQVIAESDRDALMRRVVAAVARTIDDAAHLTVTVAPSDEGRAKRLFGELARAATPPLNLEVRVDDEIDEDVCICEWDYGVVQSNLRAQLASLQRALAGGASAAVRSDADVDADTIDAADDGWAPGDADPSHEDKHQAPRTAGFEGTAAKRQ